MLVNYSRVNSRLWSETQKNTAIQQFTQVLDIPAPVVLPNFSYEQIESLVKESTEILLELKNHINEPMNVHLTGDITFISNLAIKLNESGVIAFTSTFMEVVDNSSETFSQKREFVRFREIIK